MNVRFGGDMPTGVLVDCGGKVEICFFVGGASRWLLPTAVVTITG